MSWIRTGIGVFAACLLGAATVSAQTANVTGRVVDPADAEKLLADGCADFISVGRALYADPHWTAKALGEVKAPIRQCIACNVCFERLTLEKDVACVHNPVIGTEFVSRQPADGHTILSIGPSFTTLHAMLSKVPFDTDKDFRPVGQIMGLAMAVAVNPSVPAKTMKEYIALAKARPGEISYGTSGPIGSHAM